MVKKRKPNSGQFKTGDVGNPKGRIKGINTKIREMSNNYEDYFELLDEFARDPKNSVKDRLACINAILDRTLGKPLQTIESNSGLNISIKPPKKIEEE